MMHAYDKVLLPYACDSLGRMIDYSAHSLRMDSSSMLDLFIASGTAGLFGRGDIHLITGMSGIELVYEVLERSGLTYDRIPPRHTMSLSNEYWAGYALAHAQWESGLSFDEITARLSVRDLIADAGRKRLALLESLPLDITDENKASEIRRFGEAFAAKTAELVIGSDNDSAETDTALKRMRMLSGLSQSRLAKASGVPVRTIQQYEQRQKDINKAGYVQLSSLASALNCEPSSLLETR